MRTDKPFVIRSKQSIRSTSFRMTWRKSKFSSECRRPPILRLRPDRKSQRSSHPDHQCQHGTDTKMANGSWSRLKSPMSTSQSIGLRAIRRSAKSTRPSSKAFKSPKAPATTQAIPPSELPYKEWSTKKRQRSTTKSSHHEKHCPPSIFILLFCFSFVFLLCTYSTAFHRLASSPSSK